MIRGRWNPASTRCGWTAAASRRSPTPDKKPFSIVMPPPNVTGQLHMGHAMDCTLQDILTRFKRMQGYIRPVAPRHGPRRHRHPDQGGGGTAHQGGPDPRYDLGREKFPGARLGLEGEVRQPHRRAAEEDGRVLRLGPLPLHRWTRAAPRPCARRFCELYDKGLIYKGSRIINWCPRTA